MSDILSIILNDIGSPSQRTSELGLRGESMAVAHLISSGYRIVLTNFKVPVGRNSKGVQVTGEIDIVALDGETLCFIEVKTRRSDEFAPIIAAVDARKQRQITQTSKVYRKLFGLRDMEYRFDVVTVLLPKYSKPEIELIKGYWNANKFKKRSWRSETWDEFR